MATHTTLKFWLKVSAVAIGFLAPLSRSEQFPPQVTLRGLGLISSLGPLMDFQTTSLRKSDFCQLSPVVFLLAGPS